MLNKKFLPALFLSVISVLIFNSCEDKYSEIGSGLLSPSDNLKILTDTITNLKVKTVKSDHIRTDLLNNPFIGDYVNSFFGQINSTFITGFVPAVNDTLNIKGYTLEDANLYLCIDTIYGSLSSSMILSLYEVLTDPKNGKHGIGRNKSFYSDDDYLNYYTEKTKIATYKFTPNNINDLYYNEVSKLYYLKIHLPKYFTQRLESNMETFLNWYDDALADTTMTKTQIDSVVNIADSVYQSLAGGLLIETEKSKTSSMGSMFRLYLQNKITGKNKNDEDTTIVATRIEFKYVNNSDNNLPLYLNYYINPSVSNFISNFCTFKNSFDGYPIASYINNSNATDTLAFISGFAGFNITVEIPDLKVYFGENDKVVINNAQLNFSEPYKKIFQNKNRIDQLWIGKNINSYMNIGSYFSTIAGPNGYYNNNKYQLSVPFVIQAIVKGEIDNTYSIFPSYTNISNHYIVYDLNKINYGVIRGDSVNLIITYTLP